MLRILPRAIALAICVLCLAAIQAVAQVEQTRPIQQEAVKKAIPTLRQAIEKRFGRPDRIFGGINSLLCYWLESGDTLTFVLADEKVVGIEHSVKADLKDLVGEKVTLNGVYNGMAKADPEIIMANGQWFWLSNDRAASHHGELVSVTGVLRYFPATHGPPDVQGIPPHYYMESNSAELKTLYPFKFVDRRSGHVF